MVFRTAALVACSAFVACSADEGPIVVDDASDAVGVDVVHDTQLTDTSASTDIVDTVGPEIDSAIAADGGDASEVGDDDAVETLEDIADADDTQPPEDVGPAEDLAADSESDTADTSDSSAVTPDVDTADVPACESTLLTNPNEGHTHIASCSPVSYVANPPTSGDHYGVWPQWKVYKGPVPRGFYVHGLEHGGIVFLYNCPDGCKAEIDALTAMLSARPVDTQCPLGVTHRFIVTPDPLLDVRFAAAAWDASLKADCLDLDAIGAFIDTYYGRGPERDCIQGADVSNPSIPGTYCPPSCTWCNPPIP